MYSDIFADLHNHTISSDGDLKSLDLIQAAKNKGIQVVGITDHDTLEGLETAVVQGDAAGIEIQPGVEISVRFKRKGFTGTLHVLAYFSRKYLENSNFVKEFQALLDRGRGESLVLARVNKVNEIFGPEGSMPVLARPMRVEDLNRYGKNISRRHFALVLSERFGISERSEMNRIIGNASPAYLPSGIELADVSAFLQTAPMVGVLAHPAAGSFPGEGHYKEVLPPVERVKKMMPEFLAAGIKGLEVYYPGHTKAHEKLLLSWAEKENLLITGGSDCHDVSQRPPGVAGISELEYKKLKDAIDAKDAQRG